MQRRKEAKARARRVLFIGLFLAAFSAGATFIVSLPRDRGQATCPTGYVLVANSRMSGYVCVPGVEPTYR